MRHAQVNWTVHAIARAHKPFKWLFFHSATKKNSRNFLCFDLKKRKLS